MNDAWTIKKVLDWGTGYFTQNKVVNPRLNIEHLLATMLNKKRIELYVEFERKLNKEELAHLKESIQRRVKGEPLQYILGQTDFYDSTFKVGPGVLIPRPETEILVDQLIQLIQEKFPNENPVRVVDLGTGSGNIALSLAKALPWTEVLAVDCSQEALNVAQENSTALKLTDRVQFFCGDWFDPLQSQLKEKPAHLIVSNPPYVTEVEFEGLDKEIKEFEPREALVAGQTGLEMSERICSQASSYLCDSGLLAFEVGRGQGALVKALMQSHRFDDIRIIKDLAEIDRVVLGTKK